ncbi:MAG: polysaccharide export protein [Pseudomonadota bacterium]|nr:polysaccharide export protein [Pseudomonadota bacterium]
MSDLRPWVAVLLAVLLSACITTVPGIRVDSQPINVWFPEGFPGARDPFEEPLITPVSGELIVEQRRERLQQRQIVYADDRLAADSYTYRVGPQDVLNIIVWNHPELSNPMGNFQDLKNMGRLVREDGTIFFPYAGVIHVAGHTVEEIRGEITRALRPYIPSPQVDVRVVDFRSQKVYVTGEVVEPGIIWITDQPLTIMDAINRAGGFNELADKRDAILSRSGDSVPIDILALYSSGTGNALLHDGDVLYIPDNNRNKVFVMGEVGEQTTVYMNKGRLTLAEAISDAEGFDLATANTKGVYVIRARPYEGDDAPPESQAVQAQIFHLNVHQASALVLAEAFELEPRDVVYVSSSELVRWNRIMQQILPTISALFQVERLISD